MITKVYNFMYSRADVAMSGIVSVLISCYDHNRGYQKHDNIQIMVNFLKRSYSCHGIVVLSFC